MDLIRLVSTAILTLLLVVEPGLVSAQEITGVEFDWATHRREADGADNWPLTWAADGHQYTHGGDGFGWNGSLSEKNGNFVVRVKGSKSDYTGENRFTSGGVDCGDMCGKSYGILALHGDLYMWLAPNSGSSAFRSQTLYKSTDDGLTWESVDVSFDGDAYNLTPPTFLNFGQNYAGARDGYVYVYAADIENSSDLTIQRPGDIWLMRVPVDHIEDQARYEWFTGTPENPTWGAFRDRTPVFEDADGVSWNTGSVIWVPGLERYVLATEHTKSHAGYLHMAEAPEPWGPWTTFLRVRGWPTGGQVDHDTFYWNFSPKWFSADGTEFVLVFSGGDGNDAWNSVQGSFEVSWPEDDVPPSAPTDLQVIGIEKGQ